MNGMNEMDDMKKSNALEVTNSVIYSQLEAYTKGMESRGRSLDKRCNQA